MGGGWVELLISEIIGSTTNFMWLFLIICHLCFEYGIYYTNTPSNQITGMYWPHEKTLYHNKSSHIHHL